jgi:predicted nucleotidyltransferase
MEKQQLLSDIKKIILEQEPQAEIILYGSHARGDFGAESDVDILILLNKEKVTYADGKRISYPLYELEFRIGKIISPLIRSQRTWYEKYPNTALFININKDGIHI